jgi:hypothetical protein
METTYTFPSLAEILEILGGLDVNPHIQEHFNPALAKNIGEREVYPGVFVMSFCLAVEDYCKGMPLIMKNLMLRELPKYARTLISDENFLQEVLDFYEEARNSQ